MRLDKYLKVSRIINIAEHVRKENAKEMYEILEGVEDRE